MSLTQPGANSDTLRSGATRVAIKTDAQNIEWWRGAVIYQIYPRSFLDTNDDGIGDLNGVVEGLDHIASIGVDGVWLSPFFTSPMRDYGYDVADFCDVDPIFGALEDFDRIIEKAHSLGLRVIIDQVYSHTSDQHPWFVESRQSKTNSKADWYVWADPKADGAPPNNWQSVFGGGAWTWDSRRQQYYFHNFLTSQPDLNVHNEEVQNAILDVTRFWLDRGVDGFRLDALNFCMHDEKLRDNPPAQQDGRILTRPFDYQEHKFNQSHENIPAFLERIRAVTNEYDAIFTVAEVGGPTPLAEMKAFTADDKRLDSAYNFSFLYAEKISRNLVKEALGDWEGAPGEGWPSWAFSNHDAPRAVSRWAHEEDRRQAADLYALLLLCLRGNVFLFQGEELGLPQAHVPFESLKDPEAITNWPLTLGRDGARTPLPWRAEEKNAGFSDGTPWLPVDPQHTTLAIDRQNADNASTLNAVRAWIAMRNNHAALRLGDLEFLDVEDTSLLAFLRRHENQTALCVFNLSETDCALQIEDFDQFNCVASANAEYKNALPSVISRLSGFVAIENR